MTAIQKIDETEAQIDKLRLSKKRLMVRLQSECDHPSTALRECSYQESYSGLFNAMPPVRVCTLCGYAEEGWGCGYWKLNSLEEVPTLSRDTLFKRYVRRLLTQQQMDKKRFPPRARK